MHQGKSVSESHQPRPRDVQSGWVTVEPDQAQTRQSLQKPLRMPARADGRVEKDRLRAVWIVAG
ncbi:Uncharacterised protein [Mycobacterium tuberculosis]|uniref:Uncharacterized protein n=1 Tax=Mycobacterium tuberculosis TaxID=1773 RepID=A0A0U0T1B1_MYCTX|nr:Uncharacterised protein [Mycobacterium tuberculosis]COX12375.1 Uncharacterised protein [Mycobacterium tuberculosis]